MRDLIDELSRRKKQTIAVIADSVMLPVMLWAAFALRLGEWKPDVAGFWSAFVVVVCVAVPVFGRLGLYRQVVRYMGGHALRVMIVGTLMAALAVAIIGFHHYSIRLDHEPVFPRSVPVIFWMLAFLYVAGSRFGMRAYIQRLNRERSREPVIIYGAGSKGVELARMLRQQDDYDVLAFVDSDERLKGSTIDGIYVYDPSAVPSLLSSGRVSQVLVAVARDPSSRREILESLGHYSVHVRIIPDMSEILNGTASVQNLREVAIEDLLGRDEVEPLQHLLAQPVSGATVMVTGAGGSIGAELCRQILRLKPKTLVLLDQSEFGLYQIHRELIALDKQIGAQVPVIAVLGSVLDQVLLERTMDRYGVQTIYHAAAYKHVSLVENNVIQGLKNNTVGTLYCAQAAMEMGVEHFILISTDKAVRTTSVMGASKRLAEMILQALQDVSDAAVPRGSARTQFSMVRFGNVLGSSGSVVPLFREQIEKGGPVTVTHPEVTRYFMSIQEAAQLVLQAASMADGGDIFLLDMGEPVKILELVNRMVRLKGLSVCDADNPQGDIEIEITGLKPGEKLHEELLMSGNVMGTDHRKIMRGNESYLSWQELEVALNTLEAACDEFDYDAIKRFIEGLVEGADLESQLDDLLRPKVVPLIRPDTPA